MPKVRSITVGLQRKYMHPFITYESFQIEGSVTFDLEEGETPAEATAKAHVILREQMVATFREFKPKRKESK